MPTSNKIIELRQLLAEKFPSGTRAAGDLFATGLQSLDSTLGGGLPQGGMTEIVCATGGGLVLAALLSCTLERRGLMALIDGTDSFDCTGTSKAALSRLLWVRGRTAARAVQAADLLLRDGNLGLVAMDLRSNDPKEIAKVPASSWYRLQRVVESLPTVFLVLTRHPSISAARPRLVLNARFALEACQRRQRDLMGMLTVSFTRGAEERVREYA